MEKLLYRRQFIFANKEINSFKSFVKITLSHHTGTCFLYHHPDLPVIREKNAYGEYILLGYILDPKNPLFDNQAILKDLIRYESIDTLVYSCKDYNGRYAVLYLGNTGIAQV